ncbi:MAG: thiamine pyrophosphate-dependent dehydrogenase E1 component subunit alpha [Eubacteriaceae bacterium]|nr:thiamine pyrophosphate-dependent dehydrogenase E1 component subunit alpha [Eubacteriaceae bacterium]
MNYYELLPNSSKKSLYRLMVLSRKFELKVDELYMKGMVHGTTHLGIGQEANHAGASPALSELDWIFTSHRGHGHFLAKGGSAYSLMAELFGLESGINKGLGGSMHLTDTANRNMGASGIVAGDIPIAVGAALALKRQKQGAIATVFFGDGACNQGMALEAFNLASIWEAPVLFFCENNQYAISSAYNDFAGGQDFPLRAKSFGIPSKKIDGNDISEVYSSVMAASEYIRENNSPYFIESLTYRQVGHSKSDQRKYRSRQEEAMWAEKCPIARNRAYLTSCLAASADELDAIDSEIDAEIDRALQSCISEMQAGGFLNMHDAMKLAGSEKPAQKAPLAKSKL